MCHYCMQNAHSLYTVDDIEKGLKTWYSWKEFEAELKDHFESESKKDTAQLAVGALKQENLTAEEYFDTFESFSRDTHFNDEALTPLPDTYKEWKTAALHKDRQWRKLQYNLGYIGGLARVGKGAVTEAHGISARIVERHSEGEVLDGCMAAAVEEHMEEAAVEVYMQEAVVEACMEQAAVEEWNEISQWRTWNAQRGVKGVPSPSDKCNDTFPLPIHEAVLSPVTPNAKKKVTVKIEEVEDDDEKRMREKEKAHGPGILEDVMKELHVPSKNQDQEEPLASNNRNGAAERFLKKIRETRKGAIQLLKDGHREADSKKLQFSFSNHFLQHPRRQLFEP
ncbi:hypothetical protein Hypma_006057 [Hypsizygus marmoreus]|uniref:Retrotransposon gag domain-containing protein n=1 Tax=Hypsizygus marmoreus TaxID=39966 RepID=A0A369K0Z3_HYPMA|nr:hypothetical protein Hypma_006057 [Hypsizygus marmoreus]